MKKDIINNNSASNKLMSQFAAQKKKTVTALCLIALMVFMWVKVLGGKTPQSAGAAQIAQGANLVASASNSELKISFVELPKVEGRNDVLTRDFFVAGGWGGFVGNGEVGVVLKDGSEEVVTRVAEKLRLEAIGLGENPQAFINGKLLAVGGKLLVRDGVNMHECEVVSIGESTVVIRCGEAEIKLKLAKASKTTD